MGTTKSGGTTTINQTSTATATPQEQAMEQIQLNQMQQYAPQQTAMYQNAFNLGNQLLTSFGDKSSNMWQSLIGGVNQNQQNSMVQQSLNSISPQMQSSGIMDSGTMASVAGRSAADLYNQNAQFNVGALQNALNLALTGQAQVQSPALGAQSTLASSLAGLRSTSTSGTSSSTGYQTASPMSQIGAGASLLGGLMGGAGSIFSGLGSMGVKWSSITVKENVTENEFDSIDTIKKCHIVNYNYKPEFNDPERHIGVIAEEAPDIITTKDKKKIDLLNICGLLLDANKKLIERVEKLEEQNGR